MDKNGDDDKGLHYFPESSISKITKQKWANYECKVYQINGVIYIRTEHPQGKSEDAHIQCIVDIVKRYN